MLALFSIVLLSDYAPTYMYTGIMGAGLANISNNEIVPAELNYNIYCKDRVDGYGGILIASCFYKVIPFYEMKVLYTN